MVKDTLPISHSGVILKTERYEACVRFYRELMGLALWWEKPGLTCLRFGPGYLMVEGLGVAATGAKSVVQNPTVLRFHVPNIDRAAECLRNAGVAVDVLRFDWGVIGACVDPDGNPCELAEAWDDA